MKAMVYHGANDIRFEEKPRPQIIDPTDAVVKIVKTTICGTDLGISSKIGRASCRERV